MTNNRRYWAIVASTVLGVTAWWHLRPQAQQWHKATGVVWTTEYHITYLSATDLNDSIQAVFQAVDHSASVYNQTSLIAAINNGTSMQTDSLLNALYHTSVTVHRESEGAFDPTVMPLVNAWGFGYKSGILPTDAQIDSILQFVGLDKLKLAGNRFVKADERLQLDFSSIAKGLACDEVGRMLRRHGVEDFMVEIGGEIALGGVNHRSQTWRVSVDLPTDQPDEVNHETALVLALGTGGVATSGSYRKYAEMDGRRISHIINPKNGSSEVSDLLSVTVVASSCMLADAWATACMVMGTKEVTHLMERRDDLGVMTISVDDDGRMVVWSNACFTHLVAQ